MSDLFSFELCRNKKYDKMKSNLHTHFKCLKDPRIDRKKLHSLHDIISLVVIGIICGADSLIKKFLKYMKN